MPVDPATSSRARPLSGLVLATAFALSSFGCAEEAWWLGDEDPDHTGKADGEVPLTIYLSNEQPTIRRILDADQIGDLHRGRTGYLNLDGQGLSDDVVIIFDGEVHRFDGEVDEVLSVVAPTFISGDEGAANEGGFLKVDFKPDPRNVNHGSAGLAVNAGVFRGDIIATTDIAVDGELPGSLSELFIRPDRTGQRPPNYLRDVEIFITPSAAIATLKPVSTSCFGDDIVDVTLSQTDLEIEIALDGFPPDANVTVEVVRRDPQSAGGGFWEHLIDPVTGLWQDEIQETVTTRTTVGNRTVRFPVERTLSAGWYGSEFKSYYEVLAYVAPDKAIFARSFVHEVTVVDRGDEIIVDQFELCPIGDEACRAFRDRYAAENVVARRNVLELKAENRGLYDTITRPIGSCSGGDAVAGEFSQDCKVYREETDSDLEVNVEAELQFELSANGSAQGQASWSGGYNGIASAEIEAAFKGEFNLEADLKASFKTSRTWSSRHSLDVFYDPSDTQIQWWRVVTPRLRYLEFAEFNTCGARVNSTELFLSDLRDSRLILACEEVPSFDTVCHAVEPTTDSVAACNELLIDPASEEGQQCVGD